MIVQDESTGIDLRELQPLRDWLIVERIPGWRGLLSGSDPMQSLIVPEIAQERPHLGKVLRVGPGRRFPDGSRKPMQVKVGDVVRWQSSDIDTRDLVLIQEADILLIECPATK